MAVIRIIIAILIRISVIDTKSTLFLSIIKSIAFPTSTGTYKVKATESTANNNEINRRYLYLPI